MNSLLPVPGIPSLFEILARSLWEFRKLMHCFCVFILRIHLLGVFIRVQWFQPRLRSQPHPTVAERYAKPPKSQIQKKAPLSYNSSDSQWPKQRTPNHRPVLGPLQANVQEGLCCLPFQAYREITGSVIVESYSREQEIGSFRKRGEEGLRLWLFVVQVRVLN